MLRKQDASRKLTAVWMLQFNQKRWPTILTLNSEKKNELTSKATGRNAITLLLMTLILKAGWFTWWLPSLVSHNMLRCKQHFVMRHLTVRVVASHNKPTFEEWFIYFLPHKSRVNDFHTYRRGSTMTNAIDGMRPRYIYCLIFWFPRSPVPWNNSGAAFYFIRFQHAWVISPAADDESTSASSCWTSEITERVSLLNLDFQISFSFCNVIW